MKYMTNKRHVLYLIRVVYIPIMIEIHWSVVFIPLSKGNAHARQLLLPNHQLRWPRYFHWPLWAIIGWFQTVHSLLTHHCIVTKAHAKQYNYSLSSCKLSLPICRSENHANLVVVRTFSQDVNKTHASFISIESWELLDLSCNWNNPSWPLK